MPGAQQTRTEQQERLRWPASPFTHQPDSAAVLPEIRGQGRHSVRGHGTIVGASVSGVQRRLGIRHSHLSKQNRNHPNGPPRAQRHIRTPPTSPSSPLQLHRPIPPPHPPAGPLRSPSDRDCRALTQNHSRTDTEGPSQRRARQQSPSQTGHLKKTATRAPPSRTADQGEAPRVEQRVYKKA